MLVYVPIWSLTHQDASEALKDAIRHSVHVVWDICCSMYVCALVCSLPVPIQGRSANIRKSCVSVCMRMFAVRPVPVRDGPGSIGMCCCTHVRVCARSDLCQSSTRQQYP